MAHTINISNISIEAGTLAAGFEYDQFTLNVDDANEGTWRLLEAWSAHWLSCLLERAALPSPGIGDWAIVYLSEIP